MLSLIAIDNPKEIEKVYNLFEKTFGQGEKLKTNIGWHGGSIPADVIWHPELDIWSYFLPEWRDNPKAYGGVFGIGNPRGIRSLSITFEINYYHETPNRRIAGRYLKDDSGEIFIGHSGKVGGSEKGVGKRTFLDFYTSEDAQLINWNNGTSEEVIVIGSLEKPFFKQKLAKFTHQVAEYKQNLREGKIGKAKPISKILLPSFSPEFHGKKVVHREAGSTEYNSDHGYIVSCLKDELKMRGYPYANDPSGTQVRDLYIPEIGTDASVIFEVKTDTSTDSIYGAIGQLMFYGARQEKTPRRVIVIPDQPKVETSLIFSKLNIDFLVYDLDKDAVHFSELNKLMKTIQ